MAFTSRYISEDNFTKLIATLNLDDAESFDDDAKQDVVDRATADMESDLCKRFVVPLVDLSVSSPSYAGAPLFSRTKVTETLRCKIRQIIAYDLNKNNGVVLESNQRFVDLHDTAYKRHIKDLLDPERVYGFKLNFQSVGSAEPLQTIGLSRADNSLSYEDDPTI